METETEADVPNRIIDFFDIWAYARDGRGEGERGEREQGGGEMCGVHILVM